MTDWFSLCVRIPVGGHQGSSQVPLKTSPQRAVHSWQARWVPCHLQNAANTSMAFAGCLILEEWMEMSLSLSGVDLNSQTQPLRCMWLFWLHEEYDNLGMCRFFKSLEYRFFLNYKYRVWWTLMFVYSGDISTKRIVIILSSSRSLPLCSLPSLP